MELGIVTGDWNWNIDTRGPVWNWWLVLLLVAVIWTWGLASETGSWHLELVAGIWNCRGWHLALGAGIWNWVLGSRTFAPLLLGHPV